MADSSLCTFDEMQECLLACLANDNTRLESFMVWHTPAVRCSKQPSFLGLCSLLYEGPVHVIFICVLHLRCRAYNIAAVQ